MLRNRVFVPWVRLSHAGPFVSQQHNYLPDQWTLWRFVSRSSLSVLFAGGFRRGEA
jgi:hypothetical protein